MVSSCAETVPADRELRICSLVPSATEIVGALGLADSLVARSEECDWPPQVQELPVVTASRVDSTALSSLGIDEAVRDAVRDGQPLYSIDAELVGELRPSLILTQDLCAVCAVPAGSARELCAVEAPVLALDAHRIAEIEARVLELAEALGVPEPGRDVVNAMRRTIARARRQVEDAPVRAVFVAEWLDPPYGAGHWVPEMVALAGGRDVLGRAGSSSYPTSWETVWELGPELVVVAPCGFDHVRAARDTSGIEFRCRAVAVDSNAYYARPGPRVADGVAQLAHLFHPDRVDDPGLPSVELA